VIVLDASLLLAYLDGRDAHHKAAEVLVGPAQDGRLDVAMAALCETEVQELAFPAGTAGPLARIRASTGLTMPDCCVLLTAEDAAATLASFDRQLVEVAGGRGLPVLPS
jgi:predicted nucleic acid-binding protein